MDESRTMRWLDGFVQMYPVGEFPFWVFLAHLVAIPILLLDVCLTGDRFPWWLEKMRFVNDRSRHNCDNCGHGPDCYLGLERYAGVCDPCDWDIDESDLRDRWIRGDSQE